MEAFDDFSNFMMQEAGLSIGKKRDELLEILKTIRPYLDKFITQLLEQND